MRDLDSSEHVALAINKADLQKFTDWAIENDVEFLHVHNYEAGREIASLAGTQADFFHSDEEWNDSGCEWQSSSC